MTGVDEKQVKKCILLAKGDAEHAAKLIMKCADQNKKKLPKTEASADGKGAFYESLKHADLRKILKVIKNNPIELNKTMEEISGKNPELFATLSANHEEFLKLLAVNETRDSED